MNTIRSALLWAAGIIYFLLFFLIIATGLIISNPRTIYPAVRVLARIQLLIVGLRVRVDGPSIVVLPEGHATHRSLPARYNFSTESDTMPEFYYCVETCIENNKMVPFFDPLFL